MKKYYLVFVLLLSGIFVQAQDPYQYFDDDGISKRKHTIFTDVTYFLKPYYIFGYEYDISDYFAVSA